MKNLMGEKLKNLWNTVINPETGTTYSVAEITVYTSKKGYSVSHSQWYKYINGSNQPSPDRLYTLSRLFNASTDYLLNNEIPVSDTILRTSLVTRAEQLSRAEIEMAIQEFKDILQSKTEN